MTTDLKALVRANAAPPAPGKVADRDAQPEVRGAGLLRLLEHGYTRTVALVRRGLHDAENPLSNLGALSNLTLIAAVVSGVILLLWYTPSHTGAYASVLATTEQPFLAGLVQSFHRYASDAAIFMAILHGLQMFAQRRLAGPRRLAWWTGIAAVAFLWIVGWLGYWLVWDDRAQAVATGTAKMLDVIPIFSDPVSRSFLTDEGVSSLLFFVVFFAHMLLPLLMAFSLWLHLTRLARARFLPKRRLTWWAIGTLIVLSLVLPASPSAPAAMATTPTPADLDGWFLLPLAITERLSGGMLWLVTLGAALLVFAAPVLLVRKSRPTAPPEATTRRRVKQLPIVNRTSHPTEDPELIHPDAPPVQDGPLKHAPKAWVDPARCTACQNCYNDCPYDAITMVARTDGRNFPSVALVDPDRCVGCGICSGSCDSAGIGIDWLSQVDERHRVDAWLADPEDKPKTVVYACARSAAANLEFDAVTGHMQDGPPDMKVVSVPCAGWVHPLTIERTLRHGAEHAIIVSCRPETCTYREGATWTEDRLAGRRDPALRKEHTEGKVTQLEFDAHEGKALRRALGLDGSSKNAPSPTTPAPSPTTPAPSPTTPDPSPTTPAPSPTTPGTKPPLARWLTPPAVAAVFGLILYGVSVLPYTAPSRQAELAVSIRAAGETTETCHQRTEAELAALPPHKRIPEVCERRRAPLHLIVTVDGTPTLDEKHAPGGAFGDGMTSAVSTLKLADGPHTVTVSLSTGGDPVVTTHTFTTKAGHRQVVTYDKLAGFTWH